MSKNLKLQFSFSDENKKVTIKNLENNKNTYCKLKILRAYVALKMILKAALAEQVRSYSVTQLVCIKVVTRFLDQGLCLLLCLPQKAILSGQCLNIRLILKNGWMHSMQSRALQ